MTPGNMGQTVGPCLKSEIKKIRPDIGFQGVDYGATNWEFIAGGSKKGGRDFVDKIAYMTQHCPGSKAIISGYSQGAQVVHIAFEDLDSAYYRDIAGVVQFGDPKQHKAYPAEALNSFPFKIYCHDGDHYCHGLPINSEDHHTYIHDAQDAARIISDMCPPLH